MKKKTDKAGRKLAIIVYVLLFPLFFPYKAIRKAVFNRRKKRAVKRANKRALNLKKRVYVIQIERHFIVGTREELKRYNKTGRKIVKNLAHSRLADFDYRRAIVYTAGA